MVLDFKDEQLVDALNKVMSGLLPHENYDPTTFGMLYPTMSSALNIKDVRGVHYAFYVIFEKYASLQTSLNNANFQINITKDRFEQALTNNLPDLILEPQLEVESIMNSEGKSGDISIPTVQNEAMQLVFERAMELYDTCFDLAISYEDAISNIIALRDSIKANIIETGMQLQRGIVSTGMKVGRKFYRGTTGWLEYAQQLVREVSELDVSADESLSCEGLDILSSIETQAQAMSEPLGDYGIPHIDDRTPMLRHRFAVFVARENTGKTKVITHLIATLIKNKRKVFFACGESDPQSIFMKIVSSYIYQTSGLHFTENEMMGKGFEKLDDKDKQTVQTAKAVVATSGCVINNSLEYDNVLSTFTSYQQKGYEAFFIDHTQSLKGRRGRKITELVTTLAMDCREFKNSFPVYVCLTSQPSTNLKDILQKEKSTDIHQSPTAQSSSVSQEADELFILTETEFLARSNLLQWIVFKRRDAVRPAPFFIRKLFHISSYIYDPSDQSGENTDAKELESSFHSLEVDYSYDSEDEDNIELDFN